MKDAKGRCPGDAGYVPVMKEAPADFASYMAAQKAKKAGGAAPAPTPAPAKAPAPSFVLRDESAKTKKSPDGRCYEKDLDVKGKCPGDPGYKPPIGNGKWCCMHFQSILKSHCFHATILLISRLPQKQRKPLEANKHVI